MDTSRSPEERAELLIDALTLEQKFQQIVIIPIDESDTLEGCNPERTARTIEGIPELSIPTFRMTNGGTGMRGGSCLPVPDATAMPSTNLGAATFEPELNHVWGEILGDEARHWAHQVMLAPGLNLHRHPYGGRIHEYFSEDPYLTGVLASEQIKGIQSQGIHADPKHFVGNEQERERWTASSWIPSRAMHELYLLPFEMAVRDADPASIMCAFPYLNGDWACSNRALLQEVLRDRWGFDGYVISDRRAIHNTIGSVEAGTAVELDFEPEWYTPDQLNRFLDSGDITEEQIDFLLYGRYLKMFEFGHFDNPEDFEEITLDEIDYLGHGQTSREIAEAGITLLKNEGDVLPLTGQEQSVALIGSPWYAGQARLAPRTGDILENIGVQTKYTVTPEQGLNAVIDQLGGTGTVTYNDGSDVESAVELAEESDVVILMAGDNPHETHDRPNLRFPEVGGTDQEELLDEVTGVNPNTVLVVKSSGTMRLPWLDEVPAVVQAYYPGMEDGAAVANVLYGLVNPSGKLPATWGNTEREAAWETQRQYPGVREATGLPGGPGFEGDGESDQLQYYYDENLEMGYRWYEANDVEPLWPFGFGLSYTTFAYSGLTVTPTTGESGHRAATVSFTIANTGDRAGAESGLVFLTLPDEAEQPGRRLVGFDKVHLEPGQSEQVSVTIDSAASNHPFSYWVPEFPNDRNEWEQGEWVTPAGSYTFHVGGDAQDAALEQTVGMDFPPPDGGGGGEGEIPVDVEIPDDGTGGPGDGSLTLTVPNNASVDMGAPTTNADRLRFDGELPPVTVTDTRNDEQAADGGWTVTGRAANFVSGRNQFSSAYLGWIPWADAEGRAGVTAGPTVQGQMRGGPGLAQPATLVSATSEGRTGSATAGAHLLLEVPKTTPAGDYRSTISLSLFAED